MSDVDKCVMVAVCIDVYSGETAWVKYNYVGWMGLSGLWYRNTVLPFFRKNCTAQPVKTLRVRNCSLEQLLPSYPVVVWEHWGVDTQPLILF